MDLITGALAVAAVLLIISGPRKVTEPSATIQFLSDLGIGLPLGGKRRRTVARSIGGLELVIGVSALAGGGWVAPVLVGAVYVIFGVLIAVALRGGLDSCACFGRVGSRPSRLHVAVDLFFAAAAFVATAADSPVEVMNRHPAGGAWFVLAVGVSAGLVYALLDAAPRRPASGGNGAQRA